jgi:CHAT domain-containing protein
VAALVQDASDESNRAVVYRGHLAEPQASRPSDAGIFAGEGQIIRAGALLRDPGPWRMPSRLALLACRGAGWDLGGEWGGFGAAAMLRGTEDVLAPLWPLIDAAPGEAMDSEVIGLMSSQRPLWTALRERTVELASDWFSAKTNALPPHWWASLALMSR